MAKILTVFLTIHFSVFYPPELFWDYFCKKKNLHLSSSAIFSFLLDRKRAGYPQVPVIVTLACKVFHLIDSENHDLLVLMQEYSRWK